MDRITTIARCLVLATSVLCGAAYVQPAHAQGMRSATGTATSKYIAPTQQPYNSMAHDTTPFNCEQYRTHPHPGMVRYCQGVENMMLRNEAQRQGALPHRTPSSHCRVLALQKPSSWVMHAWAGKR